MSIFTHNFIIFSNQKVIDFNTMYINQKSFKSH